MLSPSPARGGRNARSCRPARKPDSVNETVTVHYRFHPLAGTRAKTLECPRPWSGSTSSIWWRNRSATCAKVRKSPSTSARKGTLEGTKSDPTIQWFRRLINTLYEDNAAFAGMTVLRQPCADGGSHSRFRGNDGEWRPACFPSFSRRRESRRPGSGYAGRVRLMLMVFHIH